MDIWSFVLSKLLEKKNVVMIAVIECNGSCPGKVGFKMMVADDGAITGSVGGGVMEYNMVELARRRLKENQHDFLVKKQIHDPEAELDKSGMICSGEQTHAFVTVSIKDIDTISLIKKCLDKGEKGLLVIDHNGIDFNKETQQEAKFVLKSDDEKKWKYTEVIGLKDTIYIFGAGHISVPLSQILRLLDFRVVVYDNRKELSTFEANSFANHKEVVDYHKVVPLVPEGMNSYVAIMSFGHKFDQVILKQMLSKQLKYLGMIGSKSKVQSIYDSLREYGFTDSDFAGVDSPIGLPIKSQTPAEIAVSIAAKIVQVRNS